MSTPAHLSRTHIKLTSNRFATKPGKYRISKDQLKKHLKHGSYSLMSAANPLGQTLSPEENRKRTEALHKDLTALGAIFHDAQGVWDGKPEPSVFIHHTGQVTPEALEALAKKYGQAAIFHSTQDSNKVKYVNGENEGLHHKGEGHVFGEDFPDNYTRMRDIGKFRGNVDFDSLHKTKKKLEHYVVNTEEGEVRIKPHMNYVDLHR